MLRAMAGSLVFLIVLLICVVALNWRFLAASFGFGGTRCDWWRIDGRDRDGRRAWFCRTCQAEALVDGNGPPPDCDRKRPQVGR